jgi:hypothetical protein
LTVSISSYGVHPSLFRKQAEQKVKEKRVADRKQFFGDLKADPELVELLKTAAETDVTEADLREQRISFAFGNAPASAKNITKDSVRHTSEHIRLGS